MSNRHAEPMISMLAQLQLELEQIGSNGAIVIVIELEDRRAARTAVA